MRLGKDLCNLNILILANSFMQIKQLSKACRAIKFMMYSILYELKGFWGFGKIQKGFRVKIDAGFRAWEDRSWV